jgi:hypothetical protein
VPKRWPLSANTSSSPRATRTPAFNAAALPPGSSPRTTSTRAASAPPHVSIGSVVRASYVTTTSSNAAG